MNQKIKELAEQAGSTHKPSLGVYQFYTDELEKFVELIVELIVDECIDVVSASDPSPKTIVHEPYRAIMNNIVEHFGIAKGE